MKKEGEKEGGSEGRRVGGTKRGKGVRREGRGEPERSRVTSEYTYPLVRHTLDYASAGCDLYTAT